MSHKRLSRVIVLFLVFCIGAAQSDPVVGTLSRRTLLEAARDGDVEAVRSLIVGGADVNQRERCNDTPLMGAAEHGHAEVVELLLQAGATLKVSGGCPAGPGNPVLYLAVYSESIDTARMLLDHGALPEEYHQGEHQTPLMLAAVRGRVDLVKLLLAHGAAVDFVVRDPRAQSPPLKTALMYAAENGRVEVSDILLEQGALINPKSNEGYTALAYAAEARERGTEDGFYAQPRPRRKRDHSGVLTLLLKHGADPNERAGVQGQSTPLILALRSEQTESARILLDHGADPNARDSKGETPLIIAVKRRLGDAVRLLRAKGADPSIKDDQGRTAIQLARMLASSPIEELLMGQDTGLGGSIVAATAESAEQPLPPPWIAKTLWQLALGDRPSGGPWLTDGAIIYQTFNGRVIALAAKTGNKLWEAKTNSPNVSQPAIDQGVAYFGSPRGLLALRLGNGEKVWDFSTNNTVIGKPLAEGNIVYFNTARDWYAIDRNSAKEIWRVRANNSNTYPPIIGGSTALLGEADGSLVAVDTQSGRGKWEFSPSDSPAEGEEFLREVESAARTREGQQFLKGVGPRQLYPFAIGMCEGLLQGRSESDIVANMGEFFGPDVASAIFVAARKTLCPAGTTKAQLSATVRRAQLPPSKERLASSPSVSGDKAFFRVRAGLDAGSIYAVELESGRILMRWPTSTGGGSAPVADDKAVYFMDQRNLVAVSVPRGERLWSLDLEYEHANYDTPVLLVGGHLYTDSDRPIRIDRTTGAIQWRVPVSGILPLGKNLRDGQSCTLGRDFVYKVNLAAGSLVWTIPRTNLSNAALTIACNDRMLFYYEDWGDYPAYGIEIIDPSRSMN